ncbi:MAG: fused MFS/spermidine synthase [Elusimicrobia bacterium]|nr:fused MFS/spermidine synthase [Elusimicrobiota bacterium]
MLAAAAAGAAAMVDEVVCFRLAGLTLGNDGAGAALVLGSFLAGSALGAWWAGQGRGPMAQRSVSSFRILQAALAGAVLILPWAWAPLGLGYGAAARLAPALEPFLRIGSLALMVALPAAAMGATLPLLTRAAPRASGGLFALNSAGAVLGGLAAAFLLLPRFGVAGTAVVSALLHAAAARRLVEGEVPGSLLEEGNPAPWRDQAPVFLLGMAVAGLQLLWTRTFSFALFDLTAYSFALVASGAVAGMALGASVGSRAVLRPGARAALAWTLGACALWIAGSWRWLPRAAAALDGWSLGPEFLIAVALVAPCAGLGFAYPVLTVGSQGAGSGRRSGDFLLASGLGSAAGIFAAAWAVSLGGLAAAAATLVIAVAVAGTLAGGGAPATALCGLAALAAWNLPQPQLHAELSGGVAQREVFRHESLAGAVTVREAFFPDESAWSRSMWVDGHPIAGTDPSTRTSQTLLGHIPMLLHPSPRRVLLVGLGSGGTARAMRAHGAEVTVVEILPGVRAASALFPDIERVASGGPAARVVIDDVRHFLRRTRESYDVIVSDVTDFRYLGSANLFTREYFELAKSRLAPGGIFAAWTPRDPGMESQASVLATFQAVYPRTTVWYPHLREAHFAVLVALPEGGGRIAWGDWTGRFGRGAVAADLEDIGSTLPRRVASYYVMGPDQAAGFSAGARQHTDLRPVLDYSVVAAGSVPRRDFLSRLAIGAADPAELFTLSGPEARALGAARTARDGMLAAYLAGEEGSAERAVALAEAALARDADDLEWSRGPASEFLAAQRLRLADQAAARGDSVAAEKELRAVLSIFPEHFAALSNLGVLAADRGEADTARALWLRALAVFPEAEVLRRNLHGLGSGGAR